MLRRILQLHDGVTQCNTKESRCGHEKADFGIHLLRMPSTAQSFEEKRPELCGLDCKTSVSFRLARQTLASPA
jgi:hypothetical protein